MLIKTQIKLSICNKAPEVTSKLQAPTYSLFLSSRNQYMKILRYGHQRSIVEGCGGVISPSDNSWTWISTCTNKATNPSLQPLPETGSVSWFSSLRSQCSYTWIFKFSLSFSTLLPPLFWGIGFLPPFLNANSSGKDWFDFTEHWFILSHVDFAWNLQHGVLRTHRCVDILLILNIWEYRSSRSISLLMRPCLNDV